jgi:hypothetical protein
MDIIFARQHRDQVTYNMVIMKKGTDPQYIMDITTTQFHIHRSMQPPISQIIISTITSITISTITSIGADISIIDESTETPNITDITTRLRVRLMTPPIVTVKVNTDAHHNMVIINRPCLRPIVTANVNKDLGQMSQTSHRDIDTLAGNTIIAVTTGV